MTHDDKRRARIKRGLDRLHASMTGNAEAPTALDAAVATLEHTYGATPRWVQLGEARVDAAPVVDDKGATMSTVVVMRPHLLKTTAWDGDERVWGVCSHCGHVEELTAARCQPWQNSGTCETCTEDLAEQQREAAWYQL